MRMSTSLCFRLVAAHLFLFSLTFIANVAAGTEAPNGLSGSFGESGGSISVVPSTGAMTYTIPFELPANRGGAQPNLMLAYASGGRSGEAGMGWSLSLPTIERATLSGWPKYLDTGAPSDEDRFNYDGRALTFICIVGGTPACPEDENVGEMPVWANGYRHYRLQVEGSFERFFWDPPSSRWIVQRRGGEILEFGLALTRPDLQLASAYETDAPSGKTFRWYLAVQRDLHNSENIIFYRWAMEGPGQRKYLRDIYYTPPAGAAAVAPLSAFAYHIELQWENPSYQQKDFTFADKRPRYKRLRRIAVAAKNWSLTPARELVRAYNLQYFPDRGEALIAGEAPLWGRSSLRSVQMEGRCATPVVETDEYLPDPTGCPTLPAVTFGYQPAKLATGTAIYTAVAPPDSSNFYGYPTSTAIIDINRDGLPDLVTAWPTNHIRPSFHVWYNECTHGDFLIDAGTDPQAHDPVLACKPEDSNDSTVDIRSARQQSAWINRGTSAAAGLRFDYQCLDAGSIETGSVTYYQINGPQGYGTREPALFTQYGAEAVGEWGSGAILWSLAAYHAFGFATALSSDYDTATFRKFCPQAVANPYQTALRWMKMGSTFWAKDPASRADTPEYRHFNMVDIDGDGYEDLLTEAITSEQSGDFRQAAVRFTRKISGLESVDGVVGPALHPFSTFGGNPVTVTSATEYTAYADINGDGIVDLITNRASTHGGVPEVRLGDGRGGFGCDPVSDIACQIEGNGSWLGRAFLIFIPDSTSPIPFPFPPNSRSPFPLKLDFTYGNTSAQPAHFFHDVTGDGLADLIEYSPAGSGTGATGQIRLWINVDGRTFRCANSSDCVVGTLGTPEKAAPTFDTVHRILFTDLDGDGNDDFVLIEATGIWRFSFLAVDPVPFTGSRSPRPGLLTKVDNGVGAQTEIVYQTVQELDQAANDPNPDSFQRAWSTHIPQVLPVVTRISTRDSAAVGGTPLPQPFTVNRTQRFEYRDPAYDAWERSFKGFRQVRSIAPSGEITQTWYYFGACEAGPFIDPGCARGSDGSNDSGGTSTYFDKALVGSIARIDRFIPETGRRPLQWLSTTTNTYEVSNSWIRPSGNNPDRPVVIGRVARVDTYLYDTAVGVTVVQEIQRPTAPQKVPFQPQRVHTRVDTEFDDAGNIKKSRQYGRVDEGNPDYALDDILVTSYLPEHGRCHKNWACLTTGIEQSDRPVGYNEDRQLRQTLIEYNDYGDPFETKGRLFSTSSASAGLERDALRGVGAPPSAQVEEGWKTIRKYDVDLFGNVFTAKGEAGSNQYCVHVEFDALFKQFPQSVDFFSGGGCSGLRFRKEQIFDRGTGSLLEARLPDNTKHRIETDPFGRVQKVYEPVARGTEYPTFEIINHTNAPTPWREIKKAVAIDQFVSSIEIFNGIGEPVLSFDRSDQVVDGHPWIMHGWIERDNNGLTTNWFRPQFFDGDAYAVAENAPHLTPTGSRLATFRDDFGRPSIAFDGSVATARYEYSPLMLKVSDAEQLKASGPFAGYSTSVKQDGHQRVVETRTPAGGGQTITSIEYLGTGETIGIKRSSDQSTDQYERRLYWDSFGRVIVNVEPNTSGPDASGVSHSWRYVYDSEGRLVGSSDARGCGKNLYYDALGRILAEDFSPCTPDQPSYTPPNLLTGDGTETFYRYDIYEDGQLAPTASFDDRAELAIGRLESVKDRGAHERISYDDAGRVRRISRRPAKPGTVESVMNARYTEHWFSQETTFDIGDRVKTRTTGLEDAPFPVASNENMIYSARGALTKIDSSFGTLVSELTYSAAGMPLHVKYGDVAGTRVDRIYDSRDRLRVWRSWRPAAPSVWTAPPTVNYPRPTSDTTQLDLSYFEYSYDEVGNPITINDASGGIWPAGARRVSRAFKYDPAYRLTQTEYDHGSDSQVPIYLPEVSAGDRHPISEQAANLRVLRQNFETDWQGNVTFSDDDAALRFDRSLGKIFNGTDKNGLQHGPNQLVDGDGIHVNYDPAGNMIELTVERSQCSGGAPQCSYRFRYDWNEIGELIRARRWDFGIGSIPAFDPSITPTWDLSYSYSEGSRTRRTVTGATGDIRHTLDVFDTLRITASEYLADRNIYRVEPQNQTAFIGGVARVFYDRSMRLPKAGPTPVHVYFNVGDHLGSSAFVIDKDSSEVVERATYQSYGAVESDYRPKRWDGYRESNKFTGKEEDIEVGATYFGARYYNARLGRWLSADPATIHGFGGDLNPYAYVSGRVTSFVDPLGLDACGGDGSVDCVVVRGPPRESRAADRAAALANSYIPPPSQHAMHALTIKLLLQQVPQALDGTDKRRVLQGGKPQVPWSWSAFGLGVYNGILDNSYAPGNPMGNIVKMLLAAKPVDNPGYVVGELVPTALAAVIIPTSRVSKPWGAVRARLGLELDLLPRTQVHHWLIPQGGKGALTLEGFANEQWGRFVPEAIRNARWNLMVPPPTEQGLASMAWHQGLHGKGPFALGLWGRLWYGSPGWAKAAAAGVPVATGAAAYAGSSD
jgi:RHS repeat-associated protein